MQKKIIDHFTLGGTQAGPSMPGLRLQAMIGKEIGVDMIHHTLVVPTGNGITIAQPGDQIILYEDKTLEVIKNVEGNK